MPVGATDKNGRRYDFSFRKIGYCADYDVYVENQMRKTIALLWDKIDVLNHIRNNYEVQFVLQIVPTIYPSDVAPCLVPAMDIIDFCYKTRTEIDIDLYIMDEVGSTDRQ